MNFLIDERRVLNFYEQLEYSAIKPTFSDKFFEMIGIGVKNIPDIPYERFYHYENLLQKFENIDSEKYNILHKGTPFYFMSWTAFQMKNYEKALFYMDAAIAEDIKNFPQKWKTKPPFKFLTLDQANDHAAVNIVKNIYGYLTLHVERFNNISGLSPITVDEIIEKFIKPLIEHKSTHTLVTSFYTYLLAFSNYSNELKLLASNEGSVEPYLSHLFKGGVLFESILKVLYPNCKNKILRQIFRDPQFQADFKITNVESSSKSLNEILSKIQGDDIQTSFNTISKLRNTTGHNLLWDSVFSELNYTKFFNQQVNAIFYIINNKYIME